MSLQSPIFAALFPLLLLLPALEYYGGRRRRAALSRFLGTGAAASRPDRRRLAFTLLAAALAITALTRPQWGTETRTMQRNGRDVAIMLDVSRSMLARDVEPDRITKTKAAIATLIGSLDPAAGHRFKLFAFAGRAAVLCPFTDDHALFLDLLDAAGPVSVPHGGTRIEDALGRALAGHNTGEGAYLDVILLSDGEDHGGLSGESARRAAALGIAVHTVGIGDARDGATIPASTEDGAAAKPLLYDGRAVRSRLDIEPLQRLAEETGGVFIQAGVDAIDLRPLFHDQVASKPGRPREGAAQELPVERFQWFVALAALALVAAQIPTRTDKG